MAMNGMASAVVFSMGAVYATKLGLSVEKVGLLMAMIMAGALLLQYRSAGFQIILIAGQ